MSNWNWFIGQKVICVDDDFRPDGLLQRLADMARHPFLNHPARDEICEVNYIHVDPDGVWLSLSGYRDWYFHPWHFRPAVEFKNDISELQAALDRVNNREVTDA
jgi:hypothetical protein